MEHDIFEAVKRSTEHMRLEEAIDRFVRESNMIERIAPTTAKHFSAHRKFLNSPISIEALVEFVSYVQPDAELRDRVTVPGVRVGEHIAPPSGPDIRGNLESILVIEDPWEQHCAYEVLHPFTDGNGRSGRALWLLRFYNHPSLDPYAIERGFLHSFYYHTLSHQR